MAQGNLHVSLYTLLNLQIVRTMLWIEVVFDRWLFSSMLMLWLTVIKIMVALPLNYLNHDCLCDNRLHCHLNCPHHVFLYPQQDFVHDVKRKKKEFDDGGRDDYHDGYSYDDDLGGYGCCNSDNDATVAN